MKNNTITRIKNKEFCWGQRTYIMGIINMSADSFSGDGVTSEKNALEQAKRFISEGADILDIGGESTRPGAAGIPTAEEIQRIIPVIKRLSHETDIPISVDTSKYEVAREALSAGAAILNDQWGLKTAPSMAKLAAENNIPVILMSNQRDTGGYDSSIGRDTGYFSDVMTEIVRTLRDSIRTALESGVSEENIIVDPGIGFGKTWQQDIEIIRRLKELEILGKPILIGPSRKSLIKMLLNLPANDRVEGTAAVVAIGIANGADIVRVHDVKQMARVCRMADAIARGRV